MRLRYFLFLVIICGCTTTVAAQTAVPDLILYNGVVITVDSTFSTGQAVGIAGERIVAVGQNDAVLSLAGPKTRRIDLSGRTVVPGFIDTHNHMLAAGLADLKVNVADARSMADVLAAIGTRVKQTPKGQWVETSGAWHESKLKEQRLPTRWDLDTVSPDHPVYVARGGHTVVVNSLALTMAGITKETPSPEGGEIIKDPKTGEPTGLLFEGPAIAFVRKLMPAPTRQQKLDALKRIMPKYLAVGLTGVREAGLSLDDIDVYRELQRKGELSIRTTAMLRFTGQEPTERLVAVFDSADALRRLNDATFRLDGIKLVLDGGIETAYMSEPYANDPHHYGVQTIPTEKVRDIVWLGQRRGWRMGFHAVGDRAIDTILAVYEEANTTQSIVGKRWSIEHAIYPSPDATARMKALGLVINSQTAHLYALGANMVTYWGTARANTATPNRTWLDAGLIVPGGSDAPVCPYAPLLIIQTEVTRQTDVAGILGPDQRVSRQEALRMHTIWGAYATMEETVKGSIQPGKLADLVVLTDNPLTAPEARLKDITVGMTVVGGKVVYEGKKNSGR